MLVVNNVLLRVVSNDIERGSLRIPEGVTTIGERAFAYCTGLVHVEIPGSVRTIGDSAFYGCTGLTTLVIPEKVTTIGYEAFAHCAGLTQLEIPDSVTTIGEGAFHGCENVATIVLFSNSNPTRLQEQLQSLFSKAVIETVQPLLSKSSGKRPSLFDQGDESGKEASISQAASTPSPK